MSLTNDLVYRPSLLSRVKNAIEYISRVANYISAISVMIMVLLVCIHILGRTLFRRPIDGTYEAVGLLAVLVIGLSLSRCELNDGHISVDVLVRRFSEGTQAAIDAIARIVSVCVFVVLAWYSIVYAGDLWASQQVSQTMAISFAPFVYIAAASSILLCLALLVNVFKSVDKVVKRK